MLAFELRHKGFKQNSDRVSLYTLFRLGRSEAKTYWNLITEIFQESDIMIID
jgi:hypothetical protein